MKNLIYILTITLVFVSCQKEVPKDYITLSGIITNPNSDSLIVAQRAIIKTIKVKSDGSFSDTLKVEPGNYIIFDGKEQAVVYLKNGYDLKLTLDTKEFDETITFEGFGADENNLLAKKALLQEELFDFDTLLALNETSYSNKMKTNTDELNNLFNVSKNLDTTFVSEQKKDIEMMAKQFNMMYEQKQSILVLNGKDSPGFIDYENHAGGNMSLDDLKGKYVYIDLWATWCGPCKAEIPFLKEVEKQYHGKNIEFVSISIDRQNAYQTWRTMVEEKELSGIQLYAKEDQSFLDAYKVTGIPRFILIDPQGMVVNADAPRPSNEKLKALLNTLEI